MPILADHLQVSPEKQEEAFKQLAESIVGSEAEAQLSRYLQSTCLGCAPLKSQLAQDVFPC